jgi:hypothetical protein
MIPWCGVLAPGAGEALETGAGTNIKEIAK